MARTLSCKPVLFTFAEWITGHHVYKDIWTPAVGETLICEMEPYNTKDQYAVKITSSGRVVGRVPRVLSKIFTFVLTAGGKVEATVTGPRKNTRNNGLEVPCDYKLKGPTHAMDRSTLVIKDSKKKSKNINVFVF